jgi:hypothetical protein
MHLNRITFTAGLAVGFVAGTRAGRERYDQMVKIAKATKDSPAFQQAASTVQTQATGLLSSAGQKAPRLAQSAMHSVGDHVPLLKHHNGNGRSASNGEAGNGGPFSATGSGSNLRSTGR